MPPEITPTINPGAINLKMGKKGRWYFVCDISDRTATGIIAANEVPTATCIMTLGLMISSWKTNTKPGTMINPPPAPNNPDKNPAPIPRSK